jgi:serine/threonine-protein kinase
MSTARPTGWDESELSEVEKQFTRFIGPVAKVIVRRTARESADVNQLLAKLAEQLANPVDRKAFVEATRRLGTATGGSRPKVEARPASGPMHTVANRAGMAPLNTEFTERATKILMAYVGPIARVLAKRAAQESTVVAQFVEKLTAHIDEPAQREKFVRELGLKPHANN